MSSKKSNGVAHDEKSEAEPPRTKWGWGRKEKPTGEVLAWDLFSFKRVLAIDAVITAAIYYSLFGCGLNWFSLIVLVAVYAALLVVVLAFSLYFHAFSCRCPSGIDTSVVKFTDPAFERQWKNKKIPVAVFYENYFKEKVDVQGDLLEALYSRYEWLDFVFTLGIHIKFFFGKLLPEALAHTQDQDQDQVRDHYDRGNDFYSWFLGPMMIYTSGIFNSFDDTLEEAQTNKLNIVCNKIHLKEGERMLDIGCGWGTLLVHASKNFGADVTGVTLAKNQTAFANEQIKKAGMENRARALCMDYRNIPMAKYDKITCLEMAEHVGVKLFGKFLRQVSSMLTDEGIFYLQIAGLRRAFQYEDLQWGVFMGTHVFPGADASMPLAWVVGQLEYNGFEVHSVETIGIHYSATIKRWYDNWKNNKEKVIAKYGEYWYRKWLWFLGWAVISPEQGSATCYQLVCHKNLRAYDRKKFIAERVNWKC